MLRTESGIKMDLRIYRTAVIGLGRIAWSRHLPELLRQSDKFVLTGIVDPIASRCEETQEKFGPVKSFRSVEELLRNDPPDLAVVCSPTLYHREQTVALLEHGVHVFCDKPAAMNPEETAAMFDAAKRNNRRLMIFQPRRVQPETETGKKIIESGKLGKIYQFISYASSYVRRSDWQAQLKNGGGMLLNYGAHFVDAAMYMLGEKLIPEYCRTRRAATLGDAEDVVKAELRGEHSGILCDIDISQASLYQPCSMIIRGSCGSAWYSLAEHAWNLRYFDPAMFPERELSQQMAAEQRLYNLDRLEPIHEAIPIPQIDRFGVYYDNYYDWLEGKATPLVSWKETMALMETLAQCRKLAEKDNYAD